jgi:hypothetical protein
MTVYNNARVALVSMPWMSLVCRRSSSPTREAALRAEGIELPTITHSR